MNLDELFGTSGDSMYDAGEDQRRYTLDDTRKPTVTLRHLNKLRKYREFRKSQDEARDAIVSVVYAPPADTGGAEQGMM